MSASENVSSAPASMASRAAVTAGLAWLAVLLMVIMAVRGLQPPVPAPASAPADSFSAERAMAHVRAIAQVPHPTGSPANQKVREYLIGQLSSLGLQPQIFSAVGLNVSGPSIVSGRTENIIGRLPGSANSRAILLMAHYDSVYRAPGAGDDAAGVAAILETVRAVRAGPSLKNDLIVLFTEGEEGGLLGAEAFTASHPWFKDAGLVMNFEGRGNQGPSLMFETSPGNALLIESVSRSAAKPVGSSLLYGFYKMLPNDTDFTCFRRSGIAGLNFAFGAGFDAYHSRLDTPENLSTASLQHHGSYSLALARHFGQIDLTNLQRKAGDAVFFDWFGGNLISYPESWVLPGEALATIVLVVAVILALRRREIRVKRLLLAMTPVVALLLLVPGALALLWHMISWLLAKKLLATDSLSNGLLLTGFAFCGALIALFFFHFIRKAFDVCELFMAALLLLCGISWIVGVKFPAGSFLLFWPVFFSSIGFLAVELANVSNNPAARTIASFPGTAAAVLLFTPVIYLLYVFFTLQLVSVAATGAVIGIVCALSFPYSSILVPRERPLPVLAALLIVAVVLLASGARLSHYSVEHPDHDTILYSLNADDHSAAWISADEGPDRWTSQFFANASPRRQPVPQYVAGTERALLTAPAPLLDLPAPIASVKSDERDGDLHKVHLTVKSQRAAGVLYVRFAKDIRGISAEIAGRTVPMRESAGWFRVTLYGMQDKEVDLKFTLKAPSGLSFWVMDESVGLPVNVSARPDDLMSWYGSDVTLVCRQYKF